MSWWKISSNNLTTEFIDVEEYSFTLSSELNLETESCSRRRPMLIIIIKRVPVLFIDFSSVDDASHALAFVRASCDDGRLVVFLGMKSTPLLRTAIDALEKEGYTVVFREAVDQPCSDLVSVGEFAHANAIVGNRDALSLLGAMKALGLVYDQQDGGIQAFDTDAEIISGHDDEQSRLSRIAHLLVEAQTMLPTFPASMAQFSAFIWGTFFNAFIGCVYRHGPALDQLEKFRNAEGLAAKAIEIAAGVWTVDARKATKPDFAALTDAMGKLPGRKMALIRKKGPNAEQPGGPRLGVLLIDEAAKQVDAQSFGLQDLPPELAALIEQSPDLDVPDALWNEVVVPAFRRIFGPPTHV
jgi:hypothetical protein